MYGSRSYSELAIAGLPDEAISDGISLLLNASEATNNFVVDMINLTISAQHVVKLKPGDSAGLALGVSETVSVSMQWVDRGLSGVAPNWTRRV